MIALTVALAVLVGVSLGLLGGGGSILTVPLLAYVAGMDVKHAIATSLLVVGATSAVGAISHARAGRVQWRTGLVFGAAGMVGAYGGGLLGRFLPDTVLMITFAAIMIATALAMLRGRKDSASTARSLPVAKALPLGIAVGLITGIVGAGGGFLIVPALALLGGLPMPIAVGTSLVVIALNSLAGLAGHLSSASMDWRLAALITAAAVAGALIGSRLTSVVDPNALRKGFGVFVLAMSVVVLWQEAGAAVGAVAAGAMVAFLSFRAACARISRCPLKGVLGVTRAAPAR
ncbi:putative permease [Mycolicibacterium chubuense NBB4]|uniref:Probable membrane transporter protein n=1 Tax=Mycolicibacterium chubuense (strain NBB4) TaxID=710421 RepID=I4BEX5_MYCCN|nr:sulfite exporter TauE/SafE family protein [Mycolicibacterium chubuense]AFM15832.1 putative permease [Mycolicibacterium chubuense NBB4]